MVKMEEPWHAWLASGRRPSWRGRCQTLLWPGGTVLEKAKKCSIRGGKRIICMSALNFPLVYSTLLAKAEDFQ
jgi:hypothetical protein